MFSVRSRARVRTILEKHGLHPVIVECGEVEIEEKLTGQQYNALKETLLEHDFELITDNEIILTEKIKGVIIEMVYHAEEWPSIRYSDYLSEKLKINYTYLSKFFSRVKNTTIEHFIIVHKIERVKQMLLFNEFTLSEIAWKLHYSSTAHLSAQFKKITGLTPSGFKKSDHKMLIPLDNL